MVSILNRLLYSKKILYSSGWFDYESVLQASAKEGCELAHEAAATRTAPASARREREGAL